MLGIGGCVFGNDGSNLHGRQKADYLVNQIGKRVHVSEAHLDAEGDRSFGDFGFHYDAPRNVLVGRVYIAKADFDLSPQITENFRKVGVQLNDPKLGGMFEHGGGYFVLDEKVEKFFLKKDYAVEMLTPNQLWLQVEDQRDLGARWTFKWFSHAADIIHGHEAAPAHPVTRKNDPYPREQYDASFRCKAKKGGSRLRLMTSAAFVFTACFGMGKCAMGQNGNDLHGRQKADFLVQQIGKRISVNDARLDSDGDRSFGDFGFHYDAGRNVLIGRVLISKADLDMGPELTANVRKVGAHLNDAQFGGMFERGGGYLVLDEARSRFFLEKDYAVETATAQQLWADTEDQVDLGARWTLRWFGHVARMIHGKEPSPTHPVTRKNDPYPPG